MLIDSLRLFIKFTYVLYRDFLILIFLNTFTDAQIYTVLRERINLALVLLITCIVYAYSLYLLIHFHNNFEYFNSTSDADLTLLLSSYAEYNKNK